jgi:Protein of unknown function (DUF3999)
MIRCRVVASCIAVAAFTAHAEAPADFAYRIPLVNEGDSAFFRVELPAPVYEGAVRRDLGDLRVFNGEGTPVAFAFMPRLAPGREAGTAIDLPFFPLRAESARHDLGDLAITVRRTSAGTTVDLATRDGKAVAAERLAGYLLDASEVKEPLAALTMSLPGSANTTTRVRVDASDDLVSWRTLVAGAPLLALEFGGRRLTRDRIELPPTTAKFLRVTFEPGQAAPEFASVRGEANERAVEAPRQWREATGVPVRDQPGAFEFDLGGTFPVDRVTLLLPEQNTVAPAQLFVRAAAADEWHPVASTVFYRLRQDGGEATNPPVAVNGGEYRHWKASVDPKAGGIGAQAPQLSFGWYPGVIVFAARGKGPFELAYGSARVNPSALSIETLVPGYDRAKRAAASFPLARTGAVNATPESAVLKQPIDAKRWLLWGSLALAVIMLGWMAFSLSRQMRNPASSTRQTDRSSDAR